jgi:hypothetical protein
MENGNKVIPKGAQKFDVSVLDEKEGDIDTMLKKELADQGLEYRFIDFKKAVQNGGRSRSGWVIYKRSSEDPRLHGIKSLSDPDGLVRDGTLVLAVKRKEAAQKQRDRINAQNRTLKKYTENVATELDGKARSLGGSSRIIAGYDKNS